MLGIDLNPIDAIKAVVSGAGDALGWAEKQAEDAADAAADAASGVIDAATKFIANAPAGAADAVSDLLGKAKDDPVGFIIAVGTLGPVGFAGDPNELLSKAGINPAAILHAAGLPATPAEVLEQAGIPTTPQAVLARAGLPVTPEDLSKKLGLGDVRKFLPQAPDPTAKAKALLNAVKTGDLDQIKATAIKEGHQLADGLAFLPGLGTAIAVPLSTAIGIIESGSPLITALEALLAAVPIPTSPLDFKAVVIRPAIHAVTDIVEKDAAVTDAFLNAFKEGLLAEAASKGFPDVAKRLLSDLLDAIIQVILRHKPLDLAASQFAVAAMNTASAELQRKYGSAIPSNLRDQYNSLKGQYESIKQIGQNANAIYAATQGIARLKGATAMPIFLAISPYASQVKGLLATIAANQLATQTAYARLNEGLPALRPAVAAVQSKGAQILRRLLLQKDGEAAALFTPPPEKRRFNAANVFGVATVAGIATVAWKSARMRKRRAR